MRCEKTHMEYNPYGKEHHSIRMKEKIVPVLDVENIVLSLIVFQ